MFITFFKGNVCLLDVPHKYPLISIKEWSMERQLSNMLINFSALASHYNILNVPSNNTVLNLQKLCITESVKLFSIICLKQWLSISQYKFKESMMNEMMSQKSSLGTINLNKVNDLITIQKIFFVLFYFFYILKFDFEKYSIGNYTVVTLYGSRF